MVPLAVTCQSAKKTELPRVHAKRLRQLDQGPNRRRNTSGKVDVVPQVQGSDRTHYSIRNRCTERLVQTITYSIDLTGDKVPSALAMHLRKPLHWQRQ